MTKKMSGMDWVGMVLLIVGGLNWGLVGAFDFNLVSEIFGENSTLGDIVYILVGLAAVWMVGMSLMKKSDGMMQKPMDSKPGM